MAKDKRQVSLYLPAHVIRLAEKEAKKTERQDGLKTAPSAKMREWLLRGMQNDAR